MNDATLPRGAEPEADGVVLLPSLGRPASDFEDLVGRLRDSGHRVLALDPPATVPGEPTLHDLAAIVLEAADREGMHTFHLIGHAFGNRLARTVTAGHRDRVASLTLLAAGGYVEMDPHVGRSLMACFELNLSPSDHLGHVAHAFFAPGNDPAVWAGGWMPQVAAYQRAAVMRTPLTDWWDATASRVLVVQAVQDAVAPVANGRRYVEDHADVATLVEIDGAGHALVVEQPEAVADAVLRFLDPSTMSTQSADSSQ